MALSSNHVQCRLQCSEGEATDGKCFKGIQKATLIALGTGSLAVGLVGVLLPLLPTTPFLMLSALCFSWAAAL